ncbi:polymorphic toxin type 35 domain-containing protein [Olsenella sp. oral taxon 807]|uniref:polymorphic toxin type 35 domain-containing protein n=1 Tax=Olsenella sp. oral taxon 807 TaxID=712411 RepID=UPI00067D5237|nr:polymorphic toxin type 35 domain-containing protein [Olsenella sp. oral taxon 807]
MTNKWFRRFMSAFLALALALNPIDTRAFATRALATAPESAGINDMQRKATPGLGALGRGIAGAIGGLLGALGEAAVEEGTEHVGEAVEGAGETVEGAGETVGEAAEHVGEAAKGAEEAIKGAVEGGATAAEEGTTAAEGAAEQGAATAEEGTAASEEAGQKTAEEAQEQAAREFIERFNASGEKALDRLHGAQADHILHSNLHPEEHDWKQLFDGQEPTWEQVKSLLKKAIREGQESVHEDRLSQFERSIEYNGRRVFVRFVKGADGLVEHISTGYFKGE